MIRLDSDTRNRGIEKFGHVRKCYQSDFLISTHYFSAGNFILLRPVRIRNAFGVPGWKDPFMPGLDHRTGPCRRFRADTDYQTTCKRRKLISNPIPEIAHPIFVIRPDILTLRIKVPPSLYSLEIKCL